MLTEFGIHYRLESCEGQNHCWLSLEFIRDLALIINEDSAYILRQFEEANSQGLLPPGSFPVCVDVTALYTNIPAEGPEGGLQAFEKALETRPDKTVPTWYLMDLLNHVLKYNILEFDGQLWRQCIGTAMGTRMAPTYACLFMSYFEQEEVLKKWHGTKPMLFKRYIDDCFFIWTSTVEELQEFILHMNSQSPHIKFTSTYDAETKEVPFLDIKVKSLNGKFSTDLYKKWYSEATIFRSNKLSCRSHQQEYSLQLSIQDQKNLLRWHPKERQACAEGESWIHAWSVYFVPKESHGCIGLHNTI